ncbi:MAG: chemotaxis protein CheW [Candidatus Hodarchaeota archaeon]
MTQSFLNTTELFEKESQVKKYVLFNISQDVFGVPVEQVNQVANFEKCYQVPGTPDFVLGVMNLRGRVITLIDLKRRLGLVDEPGDRSTEQIIFVEMAGQFLGMVVDKVLSLRSIPIELIKEDLELISTQIDMAFLKGAATLDEGIVVLLNLDMVLSEYEIEEITQHREKLEEALKQKDKVAIPEDKLLALNLEDEFYTLSDDFEEQPTNEESETSSNKKKKKSKS